MALLGVVNRRVLPEDEVGATELSDSGFALNMGVVLADSLISESYLLAQCDVSHFFII
jgi:hypothetical protein